MKDLENTILRYLDGEMTPAEELRFREQLQGSPEAREMLREFQEIRSVARLFPSLTPPTPEVEGLLFQRLFQEETVEEKERAVLPLLHRLGASVRSRAGMLVPALLLLLATGTGLLFVLTGPDQPVSGNGTIAGAIQAPTLPLSSSREQHPDGQTDIASAPLPPESNSIRQTGPSVEQSASAAGPAEPVLPEAERFIEDEELPSGKQSTDIPYASANTLDKDADVAETNPQPEEEDVTSAVERTSIPSLLADIPPPPELSSPNRSERRLQASYRHGVAASVLENDVLAAQDLSIRIEGHFAGQHRVSLAVGQSPLLVWEREMKVTNIEDEKGSRTASISYNRSTRFESEMWAGVGYGYALLDEDRIHVEAGVSAGIGEHSFRYGVELPVGIDLNEKLALNVVPFLSRIAPYDQQVQEVNRTVEEQTLDFTTFGAQVGLSFSIGK